MKRSLAIVLPALALACGGEDSTAPGLGAPTVHPVPGCEAHDHRPCDVRTSECQTRLMAVATCLRGEPEVEPPPVTVMTEAEFADYLNGILATMEPPPDPNPFEAALVMLSLAVPGDLAPESVVASNVEWIYGLYRWEPNDIIIVDHGEDSTPEVSSAVLVHEYIHALADREIDLEAFHEEHGVSLDADLASDSLVEGEAQLHQLRYASAAFGYDPAAIDYVRMFQNLVEFNEEDLLPEPSLYLNGYGVFPYVWGGRYAHFAWQAGGRDAILERYASPPLTTRALMASVSAAEADLPPAAELRVPVPPTEWVPFTEASFGAWGVYLVLTQTTVSIERSRTLSQDWRADRMVIYQSSQAAANTVLVWRVLFSDEATAELATIAFASLRGVRQGSEVVVALTNTPGVSLDWALAP